MEVFHQFRENLKGLKSEVGSSGGGGHCETSEYASEVSEDYNSVDGSTSEARLEICKRSIWEIQLSWSEHLWSQLDKEIYWYHGSFWFMEMELVKDATDQNAKYTNLVQFGWTRMLGEEGFL